MDYAELAKRLRVAEVFFTRTIDDLPAHYPELEEALEAITQAPAAIEALTSPPDEAQVEAAVQSMWGVEGLTASVTGAMRYEVRAALNAAYRVRVKGTT